MTNDQRQQRRERLLTAAKAHQETPAGDYIYKWDDLDESLQNEKLRNMEAAAIAAEWEQPLPADPPVVETTGQRLTSDYAIGAITMLELEAAIDAAYAEARQSAPLPAPQEARRRAIAAGLIAGEKPEVVHYPGYPFKTYCGIDKRNQKTTTDQIAVTCIECLHCLLNKADESPAEDPAWRAGEILKAVKAGFLTRAADWNYLTNASQDVWLKEYEAALIAINHIRPRPAPPKPAPAPAVIETPEEVAARVVNRAGYEDYISVRAFDGSFNHFATRADLGLTRKVIAEIIRERDAAHTARDAAQSAAHAAQLAKAREAALDEAIAIAEQKDARYTAEALRDLKARPVAAGGQ